METSSRFSFGNPPDLSVRSSQLQYYGSVSAAYTGLAQFGRAPGLGPGGREFDSRIRYCGIEQLDSSQGSYP